MLHRRYLKVESRNTITNTGIFAFTAVLAFMLLSCKGLLKQKRQNKLLKSTFLKNS